jgi:hypothetical protein
MFGNPTTHDRADDAVRDCLQRQHSITRLSQALARGLTKKEKKLTKARLKFERKQLARSQERARRLRAFQHPAQAV